jgi:hypothetical protein
MCINTVTQKWKIPVSLSEDSVLLVLSSTSQVEVGLYLGEGGGQATLNSKLKSLCYL